MPDSTPKPIAVTTPTYAAATATATATILSAEEIAAKKKNAARRRRQVSWIEWADYEMTDAVLGSALLVDIYTQFKITLQSLWVVIRYVWKNVTY